MTGRNEGTLAFFNRVQEQCAKIASLPPSRHDAEIAKLSKATGLTPITIAPIVERYAHQRVPDYPSLAKQFCGRVGRENVRAMLATNHGMRDLKDNVQTTLTDERLSLTGPRVALFIDAIKAEFQTELIVRGDRKLCNQLALTDKTTTTSIRPYFRIF